MVGLVLPKDGEEAVELQPVRRWVLTVATILGIWSVAIYTWVLFAVPRFATLFEGFGAELPALTQLVLGYSRYAVLLVLIGIVPLMALWRYRLTGSVAESKDFRRVLVGFVIAMFVGAMTVAGMYLPIMQMGATTSL